MKKTLFALAALSTALVAHADISLSGIAVINGGGAAYQIDPGTLHILIVDTNNDGFQATANDFFSLGDNLAIGTFLGGGDDYIAARYATVGNATTTGVSASGSLSFANLAVGDAFGFMVFEGLTTADTTITGASTGVAQWFNDAEWTIRADGGTYGFNPTVSASNHQQLSAASGTAYSIIPEPSTYALIFAGVAMLGAVIRRRK